MLIFESFRALGRRLKQCVFDVIIEQIELGTLEWDTCNPDCSIRISNVDTFNFLLNPLFFGYCTEKSKTGFSKLDSV